MGYDASDYDWSPRTYAEFMALEEQIYAGLGEVQGDYGGLVGNMVRRLLAKILAALGVRDIWSAFTQVLDELGGNILEAIGRAIRAKEWAKLRKLFGILLDLIVSDHFKRKLAERIGEEAAKRVIGRILAKMLPIVGWAIIVAEFVWAVAEQYLQWFSGTYALGGSSLYEPS